MGAGASVDYRGVTPEVLASMVEALGPAYAAYAPTVRANAIDGATLLSFTSKEEIMEALAALSITNVIHQRVLATRVFEASSSQSLGGSASVAQLHVPDAITTSPRRLMQQLFDIQGIEVDPENVKAVTASIAGVLRERAAGGGAADGKASFDCFISYRVAADKNVARELYYALKAASPPIHAFLDEFCLKSGEPWKDGFIRGLHASRCFVAVMSARGLERARDLSQDHARDNVLIEYETALKIKADTGNSGFIVPLHVGEYETVGGRRFLAKFAESNFNLDIYAESIAAQETEEQRRAGQGADRTLTFADGTYEGDVVAGKPHGRGLRRWTSGEGEGRVYEGDFVAGRREGRGMNTRNGNVYIGDFKNDKREGKGKLTYASGMVYDGEWKDDRRGGRGKMTWASGMVYDGEWKDDRRGGRGKLTWASGEVYDGEWKDDKMEGRGKMIFPSGNVYDGELKGDKREGRGKKTWASGEVYDGEWKDDKKEGRGVMKNASGEVTQQGRWEGGEFKG